MREKGFSAVFLLFMLGAAAFIVLTGKQLPEVVASHFVSSGHANGFMPHDIYTRFMLAVVVGLPCITLFVLARSLRKPEARINLPHRDYWLSPERRDETIVYIERASTRFATILTLFLCYVHWLVVRANALTPAFLPPKWIIGGLAAFVISSFVWVWRLTQHFKRIPD